MMDLKSRSELRLMVWVFVLLCAGALIGNLSRTDVNTWYQTLNRSPLSPPDYIFGIAWSILYTMIAVCGWMIWEKKPTSTNNIKAIKILYVMQLILNWCWVPLFFSQHLTDVALFCLVVMVVLVTTLIVIAYKKIQVASLLLMPYLCWLIFAVHLNFYVWYYN